MRGCFLVSAFLLDEDAALKEKLQGLVVIDTNNAERPVDVFYREPQKEVRTVRYPYITLYLTAIQRDPMREQRGIIDPASLYAIPGYNPDGVATTAARSEMPIPVNLIYNVTTHTRNPIHDRQLVWALTRFDRLSWRSGYIDVGDEATGTVRPLTLMSISPADMKDAQSDPIFRKVFTVIVASEVLDDRVLEIERVLEVQLGLRGTTGIEVDEDGVPIRDNPNYPAFWQETITIQQPIPPEYQ